jgi:hypothetical protein
LRFGTLRSWVEHPRLAHLEPTVRITNGREAVHVANGSRAWSRRSSRVNVAPLVAVTLTHWGVLSLGAHEEAVPLVALL